jgi:hypothetical protein
MPACRSPTSISRIEPGRRAAAKLLPRDEARRIAVNIANAAGARHKGRLQRGPLTRGRPTERRFAGCPDLRYSGRFLDPRGVLDPSGSADPGRGEGEESFPALRIVRRLGHDRHCLALARYSRARMLVMLITFQRGDCTPREGRASEQIAHVRVTEGAPPRAP